eukprot:scaffold101563_cov34-Attheya_sp.AAC.3
MAEAMGRRRETEWNAQRSTIPTYTPWMRVWCTGQLDCKADMACAELLTLSMDVTRLDAMGLRTARRGRQWHLGVCCMAWHCMAWHGMAWHGRHVAWHGIAWHGRRVAWHGMAWHG